MKGVGLIVLMVAVIAFILWVSLLGVRLSWDYVTDHMLLGAQEAGLVADQIGWGDAIILLIFCSILVGGSTVAGRSKR